MTDASLTAALLEASQLCGLTALVLLLGGCAMYGFDQFRALRRRVRRRKARLRAVITWRRLRLLDWRAGLHGRRRAE